MSAPLLELTGVTKSFGANHALTGVDLAVGQGDSLVLIGTSGSGKTLILKCIMGLIPHDAGTILFQGRDVTRFSDAERKDFIDHFGMTFQKSGLFDSQPVWENVAFQILQEGTMGRAQARERLERLATQLSLTGEQKQKVADLGRQMGQRLRGMRQAGVRGHEFRETVRRLRRQNSEKIMAFLTPDQQRKFRTIITERRANPLTRARVWVLEDGKPKPVIVFIGVGDGKFTEMGRGELKEGQELLVGVNRQAQKKSAFARFGF